MLLFIVSSSLFIALVLMQKSIERLRHERKQLKWEVDKASRSISDKSNELNHQHATINQLNERCTFLDRSCTRLQDELFEAQRICSNLRGELMTIQPPPQDALDAQEDMRYFRNKISAAFGIPEDLVFPDRKKPEEKRIKTRLLDI